MTLMVLDTNQSHGGESLLRDPDDRQCLPCQNIARSLRGDGENDGHHVTMAKGHNTIQPMLLLDSKRPFFVEGL